MKRALKPVISVRARKDSEETPDHELFLKETTMSAPVSLDQSIGRLRLTKTKSFILASLLIWALVTLVSAPVQATGQPANTFVILLSGPYEPVVDCPNFGLLVNLCDGSYSTTKIFRVSGLPQNDSAQAPGETESPIGNFYVQFSGSPQHAAYDLPGGALTMVFTAINLTPVPDGQGGTYLVGTADLNITEATGIFQPFLGGHNKMVDILRQLPDGTFVEHCFCIISRT